MLIQTSFVEKYNFVTYVIFLEDFVFDQTVRFLFRDQANHITVHITTLNTE